MLCWYILQLIQFYIFTVFSNVYYDMSLFHQVTCEFLSSLLICSWMHVHFSMEFCLHSGCNCFES